MALFDGIAQLLQQRRPWIGPLEFDCSMSETHAVDVALTDNPIEGLLGGAGVVTDHATVMPRALELVVLASNSPDRLVGTFALITATRHLRMWRKLRDLCLRREIVTVITTAELYPSMMIRRVGMVRTGANSGCPEFPVSLRQVQFAQVPGVQELSDAVSELALAEQDVGAQATATRALADVAALL